MIPADVGAIYGFTTGVYEFNPSQGFSLYSAARKSFSQEIAVSPALAIQADDQSTKQAATKNWFNQKEIAILDQPVNEVEIRFQAIYLLNSFYLGLYFGGQDIDLAVIKKTNKAPLDLSQLAKMAVYKREEAEKPVTFGVYEHESPKGDGWLTPSLNAPKFELGEWYRIRMILQGTSLQVKVWKESDEGSAASQSYQVSVTPSQKIIGVISSGASVEYQFIKPENKIAITANTTLRPKTSRCSIPCSFTKNGELAQTEPLQLEKDREKDARATLDYLMSPNIQGANGVTNLNAVSKMQILREHYIYMTEKTKLTLDGKVIQDYVVPCRVNSSGVTIDIVEGSIGSRPESNSYLISLISESLFDNDAQYVNLRLSDIYATYTTERGPLNDELDQKITELHRKYISQGAVFQFGSFSLQANKEALKKQQYVYTAPMKDEKGAVIKDKNAKPLQDYFLLTILNASKDGYDYHTRGNPGVTYTDMLTHGRDVWGITSLITGNLYGSKDSRPLHTRYAVGDLIDRFEYAVKLPPALKRALIEAQAQYKEVMQPTGQTTDAPDTGSSTKKTTDKDISSKTSSGGGLDTGKVLHIDKPANTSGQKKADEASGGDYSWGT